MTAIRHPFDDRDLKVVMRAWGAEHGLYARPGGWIYNDRSRAVTQGWWSAWSSHRHDVLDWLTRRETAFDSFRQMVEETSLTYRPTIHPTNAHRRWLADSYDRAQQMRGDARRAYRGR
jgi:hypothetical protein